MSGLGITVADGLLRYPELYYLALARPTEWGFRPMVDQAGALVGLVGTRHLQRYTDALWIYSRTEVPALASWPRSSAEAPFGARPRRPGRHRPRAPGAAGARRTLRSRARAGVLRSMDSLGHDHRHESHMTTLNTVLLVLLPLAVFAGLLAWTTHKDQ